MRSPVGAVLGPVLGLVLGTALLVGCGGDPQESYCSVVEDKQVEIGQVIGAGGGDALLNALPIFRDLRDEAPSDIRADWGTLVGALEGLADALDDAGVDPATYDRDTPPDALTPAQQDRIDAAAAELADPATVAAFDSVQQHAKDVCGTPLQVT